MLRPEQVLALAEMAVNDCIENLLLDTFSTDHRFVNLVHEMKAEHHELIRERIKATFATLREDLTGKVSK